MSKPISSLSDLEIRETATFRRFMHYVSLLSYAKKVGEISAAKVMDVKLVQHDIRKILGRHPEWKPLCRFIDLEDKS